MRHPAWLWIAFAVVHIAVPVVTLLRPGNPLGDVTDVYPFWVANGMATGQWVGIQLPWVYPVLALVPMVLARVAGDQAYTATFLVLVTLAHGLALAVVLGRKPSSRRLAAGWWWVGFILLLGIVAVGRIDSFATALAVVGLAVLARRPRVAAVLLTLGAWIKVWPAAIVAVLVVADPRRRAIAIVAGATSVVIALAVLILGGNPFSFLGEQGSRGLQLESAFSVPFLLGGANGPWSVYYDTDLFTYQIRGPGVGDVAAVATPLLLVVALALLVMVGVAVHRGADPVHVVPWAALGLTATLISVNKVGSPQFVGWLAAPIIAGLLAGGFRLRTGFGLPAAAALVIAGITQLIYPLRYSHLVDMETSMVLVLAARSVLELALALGSAVVLLRLALRAPALRPLPEGAPS